MGTKVNLGTGATGILPVVNGGTGSSTGAQVPLVSGTNIKTVNGISVLGSGDIVIVSNPTWVIKTTNYTAVANDSLLCNTNGGAFSITLPVSPVLNDIVRIADYLGTFVTNNLTVVRNGSLIMGLAENMIVSRSNVSLVLVYIDTTVGWKVL